MGVIKDISVELGMSVNDIQQIVRTAPKRYKVYRIPKRNNKGWRVIAQPSYELKLIQRYLMTDKLSGFPVHQAAKAYKRGSSISKNAQFHKNSNVILKLDFKDFFPSLLVKDWEALAKRICPEAIDLAELSIYNNILFWGAGTARATCLSIGAPSSPLLSNIIMHELDEKFRAAAKSENAKYTRYADDITISARNSETVIEVEKILRAIVKSTRRPKLIFNDEKRGLYTKGQRRMVTGLIITPSKDISIGRERKRLISAMMHRAKLGQLDPSSLAKLRGYLAFAMDAEDQFVERLRNKYGSGVVDSVLAAK